MYSLSKQIIVSDKTKIKYRIHNGKNKKWLVFLHGFRVNSSVWTEYLSYFEKKGYSTLVLDLRGHGKSGKPDKISKYVLSRYSKDLEEIISHEKIPKFTLIGYSMGGTIALDYYGRNPKKILKLILISTSSEIRSSLRKKSRVLFPIAMTVLDSIRALYMKFYKNTTELLDFSKLKNKDGLEILFEISKDNVCRLNIPEFASIIAFNAKKSAKKVSVPTLILGGKSDELFSESSFKFLKHQIKTAKLKLFEGTHCMVFVSPKKIIKEINNFILQK